MQQLIMLLKKYFYKELYLELLLRVKLALTNQPISRSVLNLIEKMILVYIYIYIIFKDD